MLLWRGSEDVVFSERSNIHRNVSCAILCKEEENMYTYSFRNKQWKGNNQNLIKTIACGLKGELGEWAQKGNLHFSE